MSGWLDSWESYSRVVLQTLCPSWKRLYLVRYLSVKPMFFIFVLQVLSVLNLGVHPFSATRNICVALVSMFSYFCCSCGVHAPCLEASFCKLVAASTRNCS